MDAGVATGTVLLMIKSCAVASWLLTYEQVPQRMAEWIATTIKYPPVIILMMNVIVIIIGGGGICRPRSCCWHRFSCRSRRRSA